MPSLKCLACHVQWADTKAYFQEYGTFYGDGVVETFIVVPNKPQRFAIHLTSNRFIYQGLAMIVFIDGNYQCNRNRINLLPPKKGLSRSRTEIDFLLRQKERPMGEGFYMGREWRFDDHNIVPELPQGVKHSHFDLLGTIEVLVLRCSANNSVETNASPTSSGAQSDILHHGLVGEGANDDKYTREESEDVVGGDAETESDADLEFAGILPFDGSTDPPPLGPGYDGAGQAHGRWGWKWQPDDGRRFEPGYVGSSSDPTGSSLPPRSGGRFGQVDDPYASNMPFRGPAPSIGSVSGHPEKRVHFDYGPKTEVPHLRDDRYNDRYQDTRGPPPWSAQPGSQYTPGLSNWEERQPQNYGSARPRDDFPTESSRHYMYNAENGRYNDHPPPHGSFVHTTPPPPPPAFPPHPPPMHPTRLPAPPTWMSAPFASTLMPPQHYPTSCCVPGAWPAYAQPSFAHGPGFPPTGPIPHVGFSAGPNPPSVAAAIAQAGANGKMPNGTDPTKKQNNESDEAWVAQAVAGASGNSNTTGVDDWGPSNYTSNVQTGYHDQHKPNDANQGDDGWGNPANAQSGDQRYQNTNKADDDWVKSTTNNKPDENWGSQPANTPGWQENKDEGWGAVASNNLGVPNESGVRQLYGPHGAYFTLKSSASDDVPADAEEEPRYDIPQKLVNEKGSSKQVQPGKGYMYFKKRLSPDYLDSMEEPYAHFVFKYRTREQLKNEIGIEIDSEPTGNEEVQSLQDMDKNELIEMLLRAKGALGGKIPSPPAKVTSPTAPASFEPVPVDPPEQNFLKYKMPPMPNISNGSGLGISGAGTGNINQNIDLNWGEDNAHNNTNASGPLPLRPGIPNPNASGLAPPSQYQSQYPTQAGHLPNPAAADAAAGAGQIPMQFGFGHNAAAGYAEYGATGAAGAGAGAGGTGTSHIPPRPSDNVQPPPPPSPSIANGWTCETAPGGQAGEDWRSNGPAVPLPKSGW